MNLKLKYLGDFLPAFLEEIEKNAGIKETLKSGTKSVSTALKSLGTGAKALGDKANNATLRVASKIPPKLISHGHEIAKAITGHSV